MENSLLEGEYFMLNLSKKPQFIMIQITLNFLSHKWSFVMEAFAFEPYSLGEYPLSSQDEIDSDWSCMEILKIQNSKD